MACNTSPAASKEAAWGISLDNISYKASQTWMAYRCDGGRLDVTNDSSTVRPSVESEVIRWC